MSSILCEAQKKILTFSPPCTPAHAAAEQVLFPHEVASNPEREDTAKKGHPALVQGAPPSLVKLRLHTL